MYYVHELEESIPCCKDVNSFQIYLQIQCKIPVTFFVAINKSIIKFMWNQNPPRIAKVFFIKKNKVCSPLLPGFKACHKATEIKQWYWPKDRHGDRSASD